MSATSNGSRYWGPRNNVLVRGSNPSPTPTGSVPAPSARSGGPVQHAGSLRDLDEPRRNAGDPVQHPHAAAEQAGTFRSSAFAACWPASPCRCFILGLFGAWFIARQLVRSHRGAGEERRSDRRRRLHAAARGRAPRRARRSAICARAHAAEPERNHHHQELSQHRAQQLERCGVRDLAGRHRQELQRSRAVAARLFGE